MSDQPPTELGRGRAVARRARRGCACLATVACVLLMSPRARADVSAPGDPPAANVDATTDEGAPNTTQSAEAIRRSFGLRSDPDHVDAVARSGAPIDPYLQIPLTPQEAADIARRDHMGRQFEALQQAGLSGDTPEFAGVLMDQAKGGLIVLLATEDTPELRAKAASILPADAALTIRPATNSLTELMAAQATVLSRLSSGIPRDSDGRTIGGAYVNGVALDIARNVLTIKVDEERSKDRYEDGFPRALGLDARLLEFRAEAPVARVSRFAISGTLYGGGRIWNLGSGSCTNTGSGYVTGVNYWIVTAGHCGSHLPNWRQGTWTGDNIGFGHGNGFYDHTESWCDCQAIGTIYPKQSNKVLNAANNPQSETTMPVSANYYLGAPVCESNPSFNGVACATIQILYNNSFVTVGGHTTFVRDTFGIPAGSCGGDSGAPAFTGTTWMGVLSSSSPDAFTIQTPDIGVQPCGYWSYFSRALYIPGYTGLTGMVTW